MNAADYYKAGQLSEAVEAQIQEVKANPADMARRLFLFELLAFTGDLDRAKRQVEALQYKEPELELAALGYRKILEAEQARRKLFSEGVEPKFLLPPPDHVNLRLEALKHLRENRPGEAKELLAQVAAAASSLRGLLNNKPFGSLVDCDDRFGNVLEVFALGVYYWVPLEQVEALATNPPKFPRDLLWQPARLEVRDGPSGEVFLPVLYPASHEHPDNQVKLGRLTDWKGGEDGPVRGVGARLFLVGDDPIGLLEWRQLQMA